MVSSNAVPVAPPEPLDDFEPLETWGADDIARFIAELGTDRRYRDTAALSFYYGLDGLTLKVRGQR